MRIFFASLALAVATLWLAKLARPAAPAADAGLRSTYYRMKVGLTYKGQPVDIDIVAGCGVRATFSRASGGSTVEAMAMSAFVFGARMPEGHAVVIRTVPVSEGEGFDVCRGATTDFEGTRRYDQPSTKRQYDVPKDWLPFITWYERDDNFAHGIGYATQDAYENPKARFGFRRASIEHATKEEFEAFLRDGPPNLIPPHLADAMSHLGAPYLRGTIPDEILRDPTKAWINSSSPRCRGVRRVSLDEDQRAEIRRFWPAGRPRYWSVEGEKLQTYLKFDVVRSRDQLARSIALYHGPGATERRETKDNVFATAIGERLDNIATSTFVGAEIQTYDREIMIGDGKEWLGFQFCDAIADIELIKGFSNTADARRTFRCRIGDLIVPVDGSDCDSGRWIAFETDKYAIIPLDLFQD